MAYEIYWGSGNPYSWCVLLGLEVKRLDYKSILLDFSKKQHLTAEILAMNPRGQLPVLKEADNSVYESIAILAYLDSKHPETPLFGSTAKETGLIWQRVFEIENYLRDRILGIVHPIFFDDVADNIDSIEKSASYVQAEFNLLDGLLKESAYITGGKITAADIILFPLVKALIRAMQLEPADSLDLQFKSMNTFYPQITHWSTRIESIPGYANTCPPNWTD